jgi:hypothetical protein
VKSIFKNNFIYLKFPKLGLGNLLLLWANALIFSKLNDLLFLTTPWWSLNIGSWIRNEKKKRFYFGYFNKPPLKDYLKFFMSYLFFTKIRNPKVELSSSTNSISSIIYIFDSTVFNHQMFLHLFPFRDILKQEIFNLLKVDLKNKSNCMAVSHIGIHIRRGDFVTTNQATSIDYFISVLNIVRETFNRDLNVKIFSDAYDIELEEILSLEGVSRSTNAEDILDLIELSKCKIIVMSKSSTFSYWAGFLSSGLVVKAKDDWQERVCYNPEHELIFDMNEQDLFRHSLKKFSDFNFTS